MFLICLFSNVWHISFNNFKKTNENKFASKMISIVYTEKPYLN